MTPDSKAALEKAIDILRRVPCTLDEQCQTCAAAEQIRIAMKDPQPEEKAALELRIENLSVLLRNCFRWAKNRHPEVACEKIAILSDKCQHLLTPVSVFRSAPPAQESPEVMEILEYCRPHIDQMWASRILGIILKCEFRDSDLALAAYDAKKGQK